MLYVKNPSLKRRVLKSCERYSDLAIKCFRKGKMREGTRYEQKADVLYKKHYKKMFGRR